MSVKIGQIVEVIQKHESGWWLVYTYDAQGYVPGSFFVSMDEEYDNPGELLSNQKPFITTNAYKAKNPDELTLSKNEYVHVIKKTSDGWWLVRPINACKERRIEGLFPAMYLKYVPFSTGIKAIHSHFEKKKLRFEKANQQKNQLNLCTGSNRVEQNENIYYAIEDHVDYYGDSLTFKKGDVAKIIEKSDSGWWYAEINGSKGWIPSTFLSEQRGAFGATKELNSSKINNGKFNISAGSLYSAKSISSKSSSGQLVDDSATSAHKLNSDLHLTKDAEEVLESFNALVMGQFNPEKTTIAYNFASRNNALTKRQSEF